MSDQDFREIDTEDTVIDNNNNNDNNTNNTTDRNATEGTVTSNNNTTGTHETSFSLFRKTYVTPVNAQKRKIYCKTACHTISGKL